MPALLLFSVFTVMEYGGDFFSFLSLQDFSLFMVLLHYSSLNQECCRDQHCALIKCCSLTLNPDIALGKSHSLWVKWAKCWFSSPALLTISAVIELSLLEYKV